MRIFYAAGSRPNDALPASSIWRANLYMALVGLGHDVVEFDFDLAPYDKHCDLRRPESAAFVAGHRSVLETALLEQGSKAHAQEPLDMFFSYFYSAFARPAIIPAIGDMGITTVNWYCNASYQFNLVSDIAPAYSYCLEPEEFRLRDYRAIGARPIYCQEAANPDRYKPLDLPREYDITFAGAAYGDRPDYVRALLDAGLDAHAWGPGWSGLALLPAAAARSRRALGQGKRRLLGRPLHPPVLRHPPRLPRSACGGLLSEIGGAGAVTLRIAIVGGQLGEPTGLVGWFEARRASIARSTSARPEAQTGCRPASGSEMSTELAAEHVRDAALGRS